MRKRRFRTPSPKQRDDFAARMKRREKMGVEIASDWTAQLCLDTMAMVLNDPQVMGRNVFGAKRLTKLCEAFNERYKDTRLALSTSQEAEYWRTKIDQAQARIFGPDYLHWQDRYDLWDEKDTY